MKWTPIPISSLLLPMFPCLWAYIYRAGNTFCYISLKSRCNHLQGRLSHELRGERVNAPLWIWWVAFTSLCILRRTMSKLLHASDWMTSYLFPSSGFPSPSFLSPGSHKAPARFKLRRWGTSLRLLTCRTVGHTHELVCLALRETCLLRWQNINSNYCH